MRPLIALTLLALGAAAPALAAPAPLTANDLTPTGRARFERQHTASLLPLVVREVEAERAGLLPLVGVANLFRLRQPGPSPFAGCATGGDLTARAARIAFDPADGARRPSGRATVRLTRTGCPSPVLASVRFRVVEPGDRDAITPFDIVFDDYTTDPPAAAE